MVNEGRIFKPVSAHYKKRQWNIKKLTLQTTSIVIIGELIGLLIGSFLEIELSYIDELVRLIPGIYPDIRITYVILILIVIPLIPSIPLILKITLSVRSQRDDFEENGGILGTLFLVISVFIILVTIIFGRLVNIVGMLFGKDLFNEVNSYRIGLLGGVFGLFLSFSFVLFQIYTEKKDDDLDVDERDYIFP